MSPSGGPYHFDPPTPQALAALLPGYAFESLIAKGGMGAVYKARQVSLDRDVAIKILPRELGIDPEFRASFETEARVMAKLNHSNLIGVYDTGSVDGMPFLVMEYIPGKSLYHHAFRRKLDAAEVIPLIRGILDGLGHAHEHGIIHRDIKPANILLMPKGEPKIGDFGLARHADAEGPGLVMGTPGYTAPEVLKDPTAADRRSDLYAVGVILYELLTGQQPKPNALVPSALVKSPPALDAIFQRATHPNPSFRYPDARAMLSALETASRPVGGGGGGAGGRALPANVRAVGAARSGAPPRAAKAGKGRPAGQAAAQSAAPARPPAPAAGPKPGREGPAKADPDEDLEEGEAPAPAPVTIVAKHKGLSSDSGTMLLLLLIVVLSVAGYFGWKILGEKRRAYEQQQREWEERQANRRRQGPGQESETGPIQPPKVERRTPPPPVDPVPQPAKETPLQSLTRLRPALVGGSRSEMPIGSANRAGRDYFLVPTPMTWDEASRFAEQHGGHLATPGDLVDLVWLSEIEGKQSIESVWLGAARCFKDEWIFVDGAKWSANIPPRGVGSRAALSKLGLVRALPSSAKLPFFIQWSRDGSNHGALAEILDRTRQSLAKHAPVYPPGTGVFGQRRFLLVMRAMPWGSALAIAESSGGHLAVATDSTESIWFEEYLKDQQVTGNVWLGGFRSQDGKWRWVTGEGFPAANAAGWPKGYKPLEVANRLAISGGHGWTALPTQAEADGFLIEWSDDRDRVSKKDADSAAAEVKAQPVTRVDDAPKPVAPPDPGAAAAVLGPLQQKARELVAAAVKDHDSQLVANARTYVWDLEVWYRGLSKSDQVTWNVPVQKLKSLAQGNRVPIQITPDDEIPMSERMGAIAQYCARKQAEIDASHSLKIAKIRDSYLVKLRQLQADAKARGQVGLEQGLRDAIDASADTSAFPSVIGAGP